MYKYTRKGRIERFLKDGNYHIQNLLSDLLAQKEDRKECEHDYKPQRDRKGGEVKFWFCDKCNRKVKSTPSPLELPTIHNNFSSIEQYNWAKQITDEVKKLYQYIKEKKI